MPSPRSNRSLSEGKRTPIKTEHIETDPFQFINVNGPKNKLQAPNNRPRTIPHYSCSDEFYVREHYHVEDIKEGDDIPDDLPDAFWDISNRWIRSNLQHYFIKRAVSIPNLHIVDRHAYKREYFFSRMYHDVANVSDPAIVNSIRYHCQAEIANCHAVRSDVARQIETLTFKQTVVKPNQEDHFLLVEGPCGACSPFCSSRLYCPSPYKLLTPPSSIIVTPTGSPKKKVKVEKVTLDDDFKTFEEIVKDWPLIDLPVADK